MGRSIPDVIPADSTLQFCSAVRARILSFAETPQGIDLVRVTMLQAFPQVIHLKRILDFGEGQEKSWSATDRLPLFQSSSNRRRTIALFCSDMVVLLFEKFEIHPRMKRVGLDLAWPGSLQPSLGEQLQLARWSR